MAETRKEHKIQVQYLMCNFMNQIKIKYWNTHTQTHTQCVCVYIHTVLAITRLPMVIMSSLFSWEEGLYNINL